MSIKETHRTIESSICSPSTVQSSSLSNLLYDMVLLQLAARVVRASVRRFSSIPSSVPLTANQYSVKRGDYSKVRSCAGVLETLFIISIIIRLVSWMWKNFVICLVGDRMIMDEDDLIGYNTDWLYIVR